ncbi:MAG: FAD-binding oxidoreductase [Ignavibacteriae bacterium]|nr:FAD-binding oxidoreductase [Ignavibacteriota bacterium]
MLNNNYIKLFQELQTIIPHERLFQDELNTLAYGTDASFYRLTPKIVVKVISEDEVVKVIKSCNNLNIAITFRASGTSLSGQSISDSVLLVADRSWNTIKISEDKSKITLDPAVLGARANFELARFNKKIGPDPASINAATVCGIASNNASGMTSGVKYNSYNTISDMRIVFANGEVLDTSDSVQKVKFIENNREFIAGLFNISFDLNHNDILKTRIKNKYQIKNTTGYSVNSLIDFKDPIEIIKHLMIGSEGTLGFISQITFSTIKSNPNKGTALIIFPNIKTACSVIQILNELPIDAAELMDRASLKSVENKEGMPIYLKSLDIDATALLVETSAPDETILDFNINKIINELSTVNTIYPIEFTKDKFEYLKLWNVRKGLFPSVSKSRKKGTTVIIEDLNFNTEDLADAVIDLKKLFIKHGYSENIIWGHALSGNLHFVFAQDFNIPNEIDRYRIFMNEVVELVIKKYDGSLKAEHGTGRNMAPFVKYEWGEEIYNIMCEVKNLFDPKGILNPGVLINYDDQVHLKNLKPTPIVNDIIDKCIDCGFCENNCPSKNLTLTPRQRITVWREINNLKIIGTNETKLRSLENSYKYYGEQTCATDGLCELSCPVNIDTGKLIKEIRNSIITKHEKSIAEFSSKYFSTLTFLIRKMLNFASVMRKIFGDNFLYQTSNKLRTKFKQNLPIWNNALPKGAKFKFNREEISQSEKTVVYFPSCISRTFGNQPNTKFKHELNSAMENLLKKSGYQVIYPDNINSLCCGMPFSSKGFFNEANKKSNELYLQLLKSSNNGNIQVVFDTSPCVKTFKDYLKKIEDKKLHVFDSIEFIHDYLLNELEIISTDEAITLHSTCSATKMELQEKLVSIAKKCSKNVYVPEEINCCGFAGDRGFTFPELNESALQNLNTFVEEHKCTNGFSTSKTCEIGLTKNSGINYQSIIYLVESCSKSKK